MDLKKEIEEFNREYQLFNKGMRLVVAVSGGADSLALLDLLWRMRAEASLELVVAHLHHGLREEAADADAQFVQDMARLYDLPFYWDKVSVAAYREEKKISTQVAARELRYDFLRAVAKQCQAQRIALGHHADDQAETILHHVIRGTGVAGLGGMDPVRAPFVRPLLSIRRQRIEKYCRWRKLNYRDDQSNRDHSYTRNRLREQIIPLLERDYNPSLVEALVRLGEICRAENTFIDQQAEHILRELALEGQGRVRINTKALLLHPEAMQRRLVQKAWMRITGRPMALAFAHVDRLLSLSKMLAGGKQVELPQGVIVQKQAGFLVFKQKDGSKKPVCWCYSLKVPGVTLVPEAGVLIEAKRQSFSFGELDVNSLLPEQALLDLEKLSLPLHVRNRVAGDVFQPLGIAGKMKLKDFFINTKIPREKRDQVPLVIDARGRLVWVAGYRIADFCRLRPDSRKVLVLTLSAASSVANQD